MNPREPHRLAVVIHALHGGGAERVAAVMANHWAAQRRQVTVITLDSVASDYYPVDRSVRRVGLDMMLHAQHGGQAVVNNWRRLRAVSQAIAYARPDCVVSLTDRMNILTLLACPRRLAPVVIAEHSDPRYQLLPRPWQWLRKWAYPRCQLAVTLTQDVADYLQARWRVPAAVAIPNGIQPPDPAFIAAAEDRQRVIVGMGRLSPEKGFDLLIRAFAQVAPAHGDWKLVILGEGDQRPALQELAREHGLADRVALAGWETCPARVLGQASLFALSSRHEGFPISLMEAMACAVPVVSFACPSGPAEIVRHQVDGLLVPAADVIALAGALDRLMRDADLRAQMGRRAQEVVQRFGQQQFLHRWDQAIRQAVSADG